MSRAPLLTLLALLVGTVAAADAQQSPEQRPIGKIDWVFKGRSADRGFCWDLRANGSC